MDHFEMVEKLRTKANVSYEEAKAALEASDWDILDALVLLESEGKVNNGEAKAEYTTQEKPSVCHPPQRRRAGVHAHHGDGDSHDRVLALLPDRAVRGPVPGRPVFLPRPGHEQQGERFH